MFSEEPPVSGAAAVVQAIRGMSDMEETSSDSSASASSESESVLDNFIDERVQPETRDACKLGIAWKEGCDVFMNKKGRR